MWFWELSIARGIAKGNTWETTKCIAESRVEIFLLLYNDAAIWLVKQFLFLYAEGTTHYYLPGSNAL